jgi:alpha-tubulin suppressor-like RCC1 family protein
MTINIGKLENAIAGKIASTTSSADLSLLATAIKQLRSNQIWHVPCSLCLPSAASNIGKLFYVENERRIYFAKSATDGWFDLGTQGSSATKLKIWGECTTSALSGVSSVPAAATGCFFDLCGGGSDWCFITSGTSSFGKPTAAAIKTNGTLWTWGRNCYTVLGSGQSYSVSRSSPGTTAGGGTNWCFVDMQDSNAVGIKTDGTLWTWGTRTQGGLGDGLSGYSCQNSPATTQGGGTTWCAASTGRQLTTGIKTDGTIWTWGRGSSGQLGTGSYVARCSPGNVAGGGTNWSKVDSGDYHVIALKNNGTVWGWGLNNYGQLGVGDASTKTSPVTTAGGGTNWCTIKARFRQSAGIKTDGTLWTWGRGSNGVVGDGTTVTRSSPVTVAGGGTTWCLVSVNCLDGSGIKTDGSLWTWGNNSFGGLGNGTFANRSSPGTTVSSANNWTRVSNGAPNLGLQCINI